MTPATAEETAAALQEAAEAGRRLRVRGGGTKLDWGRALDPPADDELSTGGLDEIVEHNVADLTAVVQAGVPLARAQAVFREAGQMLALDPPTGPGSDSGSATIGGVLATGDSGPIRQRYAAARDLVVGVRVALPDGSVARAGGKVIKNVAGYDLAKLMSGAFGTLGVVVEVSVRLHPRPEERVTAVGRGEDPAALAAAASALAHLPLEPEALDLRWDGGDDAGAVLVQCTGLSAAERAGRAEQVLREAGLEAALSEDDDAAWSAQRAGQRAADGSEDAVLRVSATQDTLGAALAAAREHGARAVARASLGLVWIVLPAAAADGATVTALRSTLAPAPVVLLDAPAALREAVDPWGEADPGALELMRRVKARFDPSGTCNPGLFVGGI
jgi:glycolate oxidase FAD binding subunit